MHDWENKKTMLEMLSQLKNPHHHEYIKLQHTTVTTITIYIIPFIIAQRSQSVELKCLQD